MCTREKREREREMQSMYMMLMKGDFCTCTVNLLKMMVDSQPLRWKAESTWWTARDLHDTSSNHTHHPTFFIPFFITSGLYEHGRHINIMYHHLYFCNYLCRLCRFVFVFHSSCPFSQLCIWHSFQVDVLYVYNVYSCVCVCVCCVCVSHECICVCQQNNPFLSSPNSSASNVVMVLFSNTSTCSHDCLTKQNVFKNNNTNLLHSYSCTMHNGPQKALPCAPHTLYIHLISYNYYRLVHSFNT